ncbi:4'-phosphopantetheinyl transferase family protein [Lysinibacillus sp. NPDC047702]|uniref:4'-phosphopantetheinyl transferase family protein n=1 Tax=unclassified Lysinibacillus TaxID=2636778 RepID=UPI003CFE5088
MKTNKVYLFALPFGQQLVQAEWDKLFYQLSQPDQHRILQYKHWQDRQRALLGSTLIRWALQKVLGNHQIQVERDANGRPYIINNQWEGDVNLSHSGKWIVVALTTKGHIGVDVEEIIPLCEEVIFSAITQTELDIFFSKTNLNRLQAFYELWTLKEAIFKTGLFLNSSPHLIDTSTINNNLITRLIYLDKQHPVSICWDSMHTHLTVIILNINQLITQ